jgi:glycosyltransferase involved in cell wall biosynthesis
VFTPLTANGPSGDGARGAFVSSSRGVALSVIVPVRDEQGALGGVLDELAEALGGRVFEIVVVDDGSADETWSLVARRASANARIVGVRLPRRCGKSAALSAGIAVARGEVIVTLDGDGQDVPAEIPTLLAALGPEARGLDLVGGRRRARCDSWDKRASSLAFNAALAWATGVRLRDHNTGLKAGRREVFEALPMRRGLHRFLFVLAQQHGYRVGEVDVTHRPRRAGRSKYGALRVCAALVDFVSVVAARGGDARRRLGPSP